MNKLILSLVALSLPIASAAGAQTPDADDAACIVALAVLGETADKDMAQAASSGTLYYMGRLDGRSADRDLTELLAAAATALEGKELKPVLERCGALLSARGAAMSAAGDAMKKREPKR